MVIIVVVLVLLGVWAWSANMGGGMASTEGTATTTTASSSAPVTPGDSVEVGATDSGVPAIAYTDALQLYTNKRIQFSTPEGENSCQASPEEAIMLRLRRRSATSTNCGTMCQRKSSRMTGNVL